MEKLKISQSDNFANNFGEALRSSAVFYFIKNDDFSTTISFLNYWFIRRELNVTVIISLRCMEGRLIERNKVCFDNGMVYNYTPESHIAEGSIEVEVFSTENLVIPYAAIMAVYQSKNSVSMVHSYARIYSSHEIEEKRVITKGRESCWTIRDNDDGVSSFCVFHNGSIKQKAQTCNILITDCENSTYEYNINIPEMAAFSSCKIVLKDYIEDLSKITKNKTANVSVSFELGNAFTRMLVANININTKELQVTHSNFNYREHETDFIEAKDTSAYMHLFNLSEMSGKVIVYPDMAEGKYRLKDGKNEINFSSGKRIEYIPESDVQIFDSESEKLPTRIVTAISGGEQGRLPFECSLGVVHEKRPPKRMWWGVVGNQIGLKSRIFLTANDRVYGEGFEDYSIYLRIYSSKNKTHLEKVCFFNDFKADGLDINEIFEDLSNFLVNDFGYYTLYSEYPGFFVYSSLENQNSSITIEHGF